MYRRLTLKLALLLAVALNAGQAFAAEEGHEHHNHEKAHAEQEQHVGHPYPLAADPLGASLAEADKPIVIVHEGRELRFASEANLKKLKADPDKYLAEVDKQIIAQQKPTYPLDTCVVSGGKLGSMGDPIDFVYGNRLVRFCCGGCESALTTDPAKYFSKIDAAVIEAQKASYPMDTCVVSGEEFGGEMGEPIDYVFGTRLVRFCCKGCVKMFEKDPAKYLGKIEAQQGEHEDDDQHGSADGHGHNH